MTSRKISEQDDVWNNFRNILNRLMLFRMAESILISPNEDFGEVTSFINTGDAVVPDSFKERISFDRENNAIRIGERLLRKKSMDETPAIWPTNSIEVVIVFEVVGQPNVIGPTVTLNSYMTFESHLLEIISASEKPEYTQDFRLRLGINNEYRIVAPSEVVAEGNIEE